MGREHINKLKEYGNKFPSQERVGSEKCEAGNIIQSRKNEEEGTEVFKFNGRKEDNLCRERTYADAVRCEKSMNRKFEKE